MLTFAFYCVKLIVQLFKIIFLWKENDLKRIFTVLLSALMVFSVYRVSFVKTEPMIREGGCVKEVKIKQVGVEELKSILESKKGKVVLLNFWAIWCGYCVEEIPALISLYDKYKDDGLEIIGVSFDRNGVEALPWFIKKHGINYPIYLSTGVIDRTYEISKKYKIYGFPLSILYDRDGKQVERIPGARSEAQFEEKITGLLKK